MSAESSMVIGDLPSGLRAEWVEINGERLLMLSHPIETSQPALLAGLTPAERAIVELVVAGRTNAEIAAGRGTSPRTVAKQLERIYAQLWVRSRAELCVRVLSAEAMESARSPSPR